MKKVLALVLALAMMMVATGALADIVICQNKVEITAAMQDYAKLYTEKTGVDVKVITGGGSSDYNTVLKAEMQSGREPDIWVIEGPAGYELWKDKIADQTGAEWTQYTAAAYMDGDKVVGFPVAVEGYGLAYNKNILDKAGIDPATLTNFDALKAAFEKLDSMKAELGLDMVVSMVAGTTTGMTWVTGLHNFNVYLTVGNERNDTTYIDQVLAGKVDAERFHQYCQYVALLFKYSDPDMLINGTQDSQLAAFANGKAAFYHQGNWMDPSLVQLNPGFEIAYAPHAFLHEDTDGILVNPPSWYVVNEKGNKDEAIAYLTNYSVTAAQDIHDTWLDLFEYLIPRYLDGNVKTYVPGKQNPSISQPGYGDAWYKRIVDETGDRYLIPEQSKSSASPASRAIPSLPSLRRLLSLIHF